MVLLYLLDKIMDFYNLGFVIALAFFIGFVIRNHLYEKLKKEHENSVREHKRTLIELEKKLNHSNIQLETTKANLITSVAREEAFNYHLEQITNAYQRILSAIFRKHPEAFNSISKIQSMPGDSVKLVLHDSVIPPFSYNQGDQPVSMEIRERYREIDLITIETYRNAREDSYNFVVTQRNSPGFVISLSPDILLTLNKREDVLKLIYERLISALESQKFNFRY